LIAIARPLYASDPIDVDLDQSLYALDSTTIDLCLSLFPWAKFREHKAAVKMHTLLDLHGNIPTFIRITDGKVLDVNILDEFFPEAGAFYVMDRGYIDFERLFVFTLWSAFFVVRTKENVLLQRRQRQCCHPRVFVTDLPIRKRGRHRHSFQGVAILTALKLKSIPHKNLRRQPRQDSPRAGRGS
jgi:hypothetical protein